MRKRCDWRQEYARLDLWEVVQHQQRTAAALTRITDHVSVNSLPVHCPPVHSERSHQMPASIFPLVHNRAWRGDTSREPQSEVNSCRQGYTLHNTQPTAWRIPLSGLESCVLNFTPSAIVVQKEDFLMHRLSFFHCSTLHVSPWGHILFMSAHVCLYCCSTPRILLNWVLTFVHSQQTDRRCGFSGSVKGPDPPPPTHVWKVWVFPAGSYHFNKWRLRQQEMVSCQTLNHL